MSCLNLLVGLSNIFSFVLIVQAIMALHCGVYNPNILISFFVLGENVFDVYGIYQINHTIFFRNLYGDVNIDLQLLRRFASFYY